MADQARRPLPVTAALAFVALVAALGAMLATASPARAAEATCPATFHVLHDDHVGPLQLPEGHYEITVLDDEKLTCEKASDLFRRFLEYFDGDLPGRWRVIAARSEFRWARSELGFRVERVDGPNGGGGGRHPATGTVCPFLFSVLHNDRIGKLSLPKGQYRITLLSVDRPSCQRASKLFANFLQDWDGKLPSPWKLHVKTATFSKNPHFGFRVKRVGGGGGGGGGGHVHPAKGAQRCPGTFRVLHDDRIGKLRLPQGRYRITVLKPKRLSCSKASRLLTQFLEDVDGNLPGHWRVKAKTGTFLRGQGKVGFRVKLVR